MSFKVCVKIFGRSEKINRHVLHADKNIYFPPQAFVLKSEGHKYCTINTGK